MAETERAGRQDAVRWRTAAQVLSALRETPGATRADLGRRLSLSRSSASETAGRLRDLRLLREEVRAAGGPGRPSPVLLAHRDGPVVLALDLQHEDARLDVVDLQGAHRPVSAWRHEDRRAEPVLRQARAEITAAVAVLGPRVRAVAVAVAGTVSDGTLVQAATLGWDAVDLRAVLPDQHATLPLLLVNDATAAGTAEARTADVRSHRAVLYLTVQVGVGGVLVVDGRPVDGATGAGGELGHLPFADPALACPCGAHGCWDVAVDGRALARHLGDPPPGDPRSYAVAVLGRADDPAAREALDQVVDALARGVAGLVNALDADCVVLGGLAPDLRDRARPRFDAALRAGLMAWRRDPPLPVLPGVLGPTASVRGAGHLALDHVLTEARLQAWAHDLAEETP